MLGNLATHFDVDVDAELEYLETSATEKEQEMPMSLDEDEPMGYSRTGSQARADDIDALFTSLIDATQPLNT